MVYIYLYIYFKVSYIHLFVLFSTVMFFLHCMLNILRYEKILCEIDESIVRLVENTIHQVMWYFSVFVVNPFSLLWSTFFSQKNYVSFGLLFSFLSLSQLTLILLVNLLWGFSWKLLLSPDCQSHLMKLIQLIDCWRADDKFSGNNFYFIVVKEFSYGKKH